MRAIVLVALVGCGGESDAKLVVSTSFTISDVAGAGPSVLDPLEGQLVSLEIDLSTFELFHGTTAGCRRTTFGQTEPPRTAGGPQAALVQTEVLDKIGRWDLGFEICDSGGVKLVLDASINELNTAIGCLAVPVPAQLRDGAGDPVLSTFSGTMCSATILDVVTNRVFTATGFSVSIDTGGQRLP